MHQPANSATSLNADGYLTPTNRRFDRDALHDTHAARTFDMSNALDASTDIGTT